MYFPRNPRAKDIAMFSVPLLTIAMVGNQPRCSYADEQIKKMCYVYTIECYPVGAGEIVQWLRPLVPSSHLHRHTCGKQICMQAKHSYICIYVCIKDISMNIIQS